LAAPVLVSRNVCTRYRKLITKDAEPTIVVLSALSGTTNSLVEISNSLSQGDRSGAKQKIDKLEAHYRAFVLDLLKKKKQGQKQTRLLQNILNS
jgi:aspartate kinase